MVREKGAGLYEEKLKMEDQLNGMQQGHLAGQSQIQQLQVNKLTDRHTDTQRYRHTN